MRDNQNAKNIGLRVRQIRKALHLSQEAFAKNLNIATPTLSDLENGKTKPSFDVMYGLLTAYNVNLEYVVSGAGEMFKQDSATSILHLYEKKMGDSFEDFKSILFYISHSAMCRLNLINYAKKYITENRSFIEMEMENFPEWSKMVDHIKNKEIINDANNNTEEKP